MDKDILDLDVFEQKGLVINLGGKEITVEQPSMIDLIRLQSYSKSLGDLGMLGTDEELAAMIDKQLQLIHRLIPETKGRELNLTQRQVITAAIINMTLPAEDKELRKKGISPNQTKKDQEG